MADDGDDLHRDKDDDIGARDTNPFDPRRLRISQRFGEGQDVKRVVASCPVRKPHRQEFFRTHPDPDMSIEVAVLEFKEERPHYLVNPELAPALPGEDAAKVLHLAITTHGALMLWSIRLPDDQGRLDPLPNRLTKIFGVNRNAKYRALVWLEGAGLVAVKSKVGCAPFVTLLATGERDEPD